MFEPVRNPSDQQILATIQASRHKAVRRLVCGKTGAIWIWPFEQATHTEAAKLLGADYIRPPGGGEVLMADQST